MCILTGKSRDVHLQDSLPLFIVITEYSHHGYSPSTLSHINYFGLGGADIDGKEVHRYVMSKVGT